MPLSEEELRLLEQMERALVEEDPKFASTLRGTTLRRSARRRAFLAAGVFVLGVAVLMAGAILQLTLVGIVGFVIMLASATIGLTAWRSRAQGSAAAGTGHPSLRVVDGGRSRQRVRSSSGFMDRLEERWRRRREGY